MKADHSRDARRLQAEKVAEKTQRLLANGLVLPPRLFKAPEQLLSRDEPCAHAILPAYSQVVAQQQEGKVGVLIFASASRPGGGWRNGARAQEEDICLASTWGLQAAAAPPGFYDSATKLGGLGPDAGLIAEGMWLHDAFGQPLRHPRSVSLIAIAAPNLRNGACQGVPQEKLTDHLARRLAGALFQWGREGTTTVVLGAIGCGVFCWEAEDSALALRRALGHYHATGMPPLNVILAMPDAELARKFSAELSRPAPAQARHRR